MFKTLTPILSIVIGIIIFFFVTKPMYADIQQIQSETIQYQEAVAKATQLNNQLQELMLRKNSFSPQDLERLDLLVPDSVDEVHLLVDLEMLARKNNVLFGNVEIQKDETTGEVVEDGSGGGDITYEKDFIAATISFGVIGTYEQFRLFLADIERSLTLMEITDITFSAGDGELQQYSVTIRVHALTQSTLQ